MRDTHTIRFTDAEMIERLKAFAEREKRSVTNAATWLILRSLQSTPTEKNDNSLGCLKQG